MIYVLLGKSNSGKTSIFKKLSNEYDKIISITTRPKRENEEYNVDYLFLNNKSFEMLKNHDKIICSKRFINAFGDIWQYGFLKTYLDYGLKKKVLVADPDGLDELIGVYGKENITSIYISCLHQEIVERAMERGENEKEVKRRLTSDLFDFKDIERHVDYTIYNQNGYLGESIRKVEEIINL